LAGKGFRKVYNLKGGIKAWHGLTATGPAEIGMVHFKGDETPPDIIILAYGMEQGLEEFYSTMVGMIDDQEVVGILTKLALIEENHKQRLFNLYLTFEPDVADKEAFETGILSDIMEGGFTTEEFLEQNKPSMQTVEGVLYVAMMLETQALDLYLRYSQKIKDENGRAVFYEIAKEEKAHLTGLGHLVDKHI
jgi:sulfur-carrier protein adenylyltransferase/sulfurtransferase